MSAPRTVSLFRNGRNQAIRIPVEFELPGDEATIRKDGEKLIIEPKNREANWLDALRSMEPLEPGETLPDVDDSDLPPLRDVNL